MKNIFDFRFLIHICKDFPLLYLENRNTGNGSMLRSNSVILRTKHYSIFEGMNQILRCLFKPLFFYYIENDATIRGADVNSRRCT